MPSPRAVLADIHDLKLDPTVAHKKTKAHGHLVAKQHDVQESIVTVKKEPTVDLKDQESMIDVVVDEQFIDLENDVDDSLSKRKPSKKNKF